MESLDRVKRLIRSLEANLGKESPDEIPALIFGMSEESGGLSLTHEEAKEFHQTTDALLRDFAPEKDVGRRSIERSLQRAILRVIKNGGQLNSRITSSVEKLRQELEQDPEVYTVYVPVRGINCEELPRVYGEIRFVMFNKTQYRKVYGKLKNHIVDVNKKQNAVRRLKDTMLWESSCAVTEVEARDSDGAIYLARRKVVLHLDIVNFFADILKYNYAWLYLPSQATSSTVTSVVMKNDSSVSFTGNREGPIGSYSIATLKKQQNIKNSVSKLHNLLKRDGKTDVEELMLTAVQWIGRASIEDKRERSFLLYVVGMESLLIPKRTGSIGYTLSMRTAILLSKRHAARQKIVREMKDLYNVRSRIVHDGLFDVTEKQLNRIRLYSKETILSALHHRTLNACTSCGELDQWFEKKLLEN